MKQPLKRIQLATLGVVVFCVCGSITASAITETTTISSNVASVISILTNGTVNVDVIPTGSGVQTIQSDNVRVSTNNTAGYTLQLANTDSNTSLVSGANTIAASSGTQASPSAQTANSWGYRVDGVGGFGAGPTSATSNTAIGALTFAGVPINSSPNTLKTTSSTATNDSTLVWYAVAINSSQVAATYTDTVTYTAVTN